MAALYAKLYVLEGSVIDGRTPSALLAAVLLARALHLSALFLQLYHIDLIGELPILRESVRSILAEEQLTEFTIKNGFNHAFLFLLHLQLLYHFPDELAESLPDFVLIAVGIGWLFFSGDEGGVAEEVAYFWQAGEYLEEFADGLGVALGASEYVVLVEAGLNGRDEDFVCRGHAVAILIDCLLAHCSVSAGSGGHAVVETIVLDPIK